MPANLDLPTYRLPGRHGAISVADYEMAIGHDARYYLRRRRLQATGCRKNLES
jgi:hypothetical protein